MLRLLLAHGANPLGVDEKGHSLLHYATTVPDNQDVVNLLTKYEHDVRKTAHH
jgi:ankyrin repeat protein